MRMRGGCDPGDAAKSEPGDKRGRKRKRKGIKNERNADVERIGNIDDRLIDQAEQFGKGGRGAAGFRHGKTRRVFSPSARRGSSGGADDPGGFVLGAFALNEELEMIEIEGAGISLLLPTAGRQVYL